MEDRQVDLYAIQMAKFIQDIQKWVTFIFYTN